MSAQIIASLVVLQLTALQSARPAINNFMSNNRPAAAILVPLELLSALSRQFSNASQDSTFKIRYVFIVWQTAKFALMPIPAQHAIKATFSRVPAVAQPVPYLLVQLAIVMAFAPYAILVFMG